MIKTITVTLKDIKYWCPEAYEEILTESTGNLCFHVGDGRVFMTAHRPQGDPLPYEWGPEFGCWYQHSGWDFDCQCDRLYDEYRDRQFDDHDRDEKDW